MAARRGPEGSGAWARKTFPRRGHLRRGPLGSQEVRCRKEALWFREHG